MITGIPVSLVTSQYDVIRER